MINKILFKLNGTNKILNLYVKDNLIDNYRFTDNCLYIFYNNNYKVIQYSQVKNRKAFKSLGVSELYKIRDELDI